MSEGQAKIDSLMEAITNTTIGFVIGVGANAVILPALFDIQMTIGDNMICAAAFTFVSIARSYVLRRLFNHRSVWETIKSSFREHGDVARWPVPGGWVR